MEHINYTMEWDDGVWWQVARFRNGDYITSTRGDNDDCLDVCKRQVEQIIKNEAMSGLNTIN